ncbi:NAD(P)H-binding protein [Jiangella anatolica]|uniref:NmrA family transcriptional regulator n=1 Tax=Jiangella anatolica TaxID=2670374 RepID=A0A2W2AVB2_9ACTN|nr:NAD(P)H-binding protein [Jiangella anatolica]PZF79131.1 NmrA family transcriptional regulator [Jiangella anatolica]
MNATTLVLGGTGKTGARVVERLTARGADLRVGSRSAEIPFDWTDRATWPAALKGVERMYISYYPDIAIPGAVDAVTALVDLARESGVERLVLLSGRGEEEAQAAERVVMASGLEWTIVRCSWFNQNFDENYLLDPILAGEVAMPAGDVPEPFVDADDIADVAVAALTEDLHVGELYELTGPRLLTFADAVAEIAAATGREIAFVHLPLDEYSAALAEEGLPDDLAWLYGYLFREVLDGRNTWLGDGVQRALGREPKDFADYARDGAARGVWTP